MGWSRAAAGIGLSWLVVAANLYHSHNTSDAEKQQWAEDLVVAASDASVLLYPLGDRVSTRLAVPKSVPQLTCQVYRELDGPEFIEVLEA